MTPQHMNQDPYLDVHFNAIRQKFDYLNRELDEARNQRDEYERNYTNQAKELQELRQTIFAASKIRTVCQHCKPCHQTTDDNLSPILFPVSAASESYFSGDKEEESHGDNVQENETREDSTNLSLRSDITYFPQPDDPGVIYNVESNHDTKVALKLNQVHTLTQRTSPTHAAFSQDGKYLAAASMNDGTVHIFDAKTGNRLSLSVMRDLYTSGEDKSPTGIWCLGVSSDGKLLATGDWDGEVKIWIVSQRRVRSTFKNVYTPWSLDFSPNGRCIAIACGDGVVIRRLRDGFSRILRQSPMNFPCSVRFRQDGRYVASGGDEGRLSIFNVRMGKCIASYEGHAEAVWDLVFTDGKGLFSASSDKIIIHWDLSWLKSTYDSQMEDDSADGLRELSRFVGHENSVNAISISPDGSLIASGSMDEAVRIWSVHTARLECILHGHGPVMSVDFGHSGDYLAVSDIKGRVTVCYEASGMIAPEISGQTTA